MLSSICRNIRLVRQLGHQLERPTPPPISRLRYFPAAHRFSTSTMTTSNGEKVADVLLVGLGSMGTAYAYMMEKSGKARVSAVARSSYDLYQNGEITIESDRFGRIEKWKPHRVFRTQEEALADGTNYDFCVVTTKLLPDIVPNSRLLAPAIQSGQVKAWSILQNGLGIEKDLYDAVNAAPGQAGAPLLSSLSWIFLTPSDGGRYIAWPNRDITVSGLYPPKGKGREFTAREQESARLWDDLISDPADKMNAVVMTDRIDAVRYSKNMWNCAWASIHALVGAPVWSLKSLDPAILAPLREMVREIVQIGYDTGMLFEGLTLYPSGAKAGNAEQTLNMLFDDIVNAGPDHFFDKYKMSMLVDVEFDRPIEVEVIVGGVIEAGRAAGIKTPALDLVYALLKGKQAGILRRQEERRSRV